MILSTHKAKAGNYKFKAHLATGSSRQFNETLSQNKIKQIYVCVYVCMLVCVCVWCTCTRVHVVVHMYVLACEDHKSTLPSSIIEDLLSQFFEIVSH